MKQLFWILFIAMNLIMGCLYLWGAEYNRYVCAWLWGIFPTLNLILYCVFEKHIFNEVY